MHNQLPILRDPDRRAYYREEARRQADDRHCSKTWRRLGPRTAYRKKLQFRRARSADWDRMMPYLENCDGTRADQPRSRASRSCSVGRRVSRPITTTSWARRQTSMAISLRPGSTRWAYLSGGWRRAMCTVAVDCRRAFAHGCVRRGHSPHAAVPEQQAITS